MNGLRGFSFGDPGEVRDRLTALVLSGHKVATAGILQRDYVDQGEAVEQVGERQALIAYGDSVVAFIEVTRVEIHRFDEVPWEFAEAEGEGFRSVDDWRESHRSYYRTLSVDIEDSTLFVCVWFALLDVDRSRTGTRGV